MGLMVGGKAGPAEGRNVSTNDRRDVTGVPAARWLIRAGTRTTLSRGTRTRTTLSKGTWPHGGRRSRPSRGAQRSTDDRRDVTGVQTARWLIRAGTRTH